MVSIVIPVYQVSNYIERCVCSVMAQTFTDIECIIVDDATMDDSIEKCERLIKEYNGNVNLNANLNVNLNVNLNGNDNGNQRGRIRFKILRHEVNRGLSAARNTGIDAASGEYIFFLDGDDVITDDCIEKLRAPILLDDTIEMVMGDYECVDEKSGAVFHIRKHESGCYSTNEEIRQCFFEYRGISVAAWNKLVRKDFLVLHKLFFREGVIWEDLLWSFYVMKHLQYLYAIKDVTYRKCQRPESICEGTDEITKLYYYGLIYDEISSNFSPNESRREAKSFIRHFNRNYFKSQQDKSYNHAASNFRKSLSLWDIPSEYLLLSSLLLLSKTMIGRKCIQGIRAGVRSLRQKKR